MKEQPSIDRMTSVSSISSRKRGLSRILWAVTALLPLIVSSLIAFTQSSKPDPFQSLSFLGRDWWRYPVEKNSYNRLPEIKCHPNAIMTLPNSDKVWAVGNPEMIMHGDDGGHWTKVNCPTIVGLL